MKENSNITTRETSNKSILYKTDRKSFAVFSNNQIKSEVLINPNEVSIYLKSQYDKNKTIISQQTVLDITTRLLYFHPKFFRYFTLYSLSENISRDIIQNGEIVILPKDSCLFQQHDDITRSFILLNGSVSIKLPQSFIFAEDIKKKALKLKQYYNIDDKDNTFQIHFASQAKDNSTPQIEPKIIKNTIDKSKTQQKLNASFDYSNNNIKNLRYVSKLKKARKSQVKYFKSLTNIEEEQFKISDSFIGEWDLSYQTKRFYSAYTNSTCLLISIDKSKTEYLMKLLLKAEHNKKIFLLNHMKALQLLSQTKLDEYYAQIKKKVYQSNEVIYTKGTEANSFFIIYKGNASTIAKNHVIYDKGTLMAPEALQQYIILNSSLNYTESTDKKVDSQLTTLKYGTYNETMISKKINTIVFKFKLKQIPFRVFQSLSAELLQYSIKQNEISNTFNEQKINQSTMFKVKYKHLSPNYNFNKELIYHLEEMTLIEQEIKKYKEMRIRNDIKYNNKQLSLSVINKPKALIKYTANNEKIKEPPFFNSIINHKLKNKTNIKRGCESERITSQSNCRDQVLFYKKINKNNKCNHFRKVIQSITNINSSSKEKWKKYHHTTERDSYFNNNNSHYTITTADYGISVETSERCANLTLNLLTGPVKPRKKNMSLVEKIQSSVDSWKKTLKNDYKEFETQTYRAPLFSFVTGN